MSAKLVQLRKQILTAWADPSARDSLSDAFKSSGADYKHCVTVNRAGDRVTVEVNSDCYKTEGEKVKEVYKRLWRGGG